MLVKLCLLILAMALTACATTNSTGGYDYNRSHDGSLSDGPRYRDPGEVQRVKNAYNSFRM